MDADVIVVGAGAAGLYAACMLIKAGKHVLVLEARERLGGRVYPLPQEEWGYPAQGGAEFVHGDAPLTKTILKEAGATLTHPTEWWNINDGKPTVAERVSPHNVALEMVLAGLGKDMTVLEFLDVHFPGKENRALRDYVMRRAEGYDADDPARASAKALYEDMTNERGSIAQNIREGYGALVERLRSVIEEHGGIIKTGEEVREAEVGEESVTLRTVHRSYEAPYAILTMPPPLLAALKTTPEAPEKRAAIARMGYGNVIKILLHFKTKWWTGIRERVFERMFFMFSLEAVPTWWTQYPEPHTTLTGWVAGPKADMLQEKNEEEIIALALTSLASIFRIPQADLKEELLRAQVFAWGKDPHAFGAYSYYTPASREAVREVLRPIGARLLYAGEALYVGEAAGVVGGTVEAALASGKSAAEAVLVHV